MHGEDKMELDKMALNRLVVYVNNCLVGDFNASAICVSKDCAWQTVQCVHTHRQQRPAGGQSLCSCLMAITKLSMGWADGQKRA